VYSGQTLFGRNNYLVLSAYIAALAIPIVFCIPQDIFDEATTENAIPIDELGNTLVEMTLAGIIIEVV